MPNTPAQIPVCGGYGSYLDDTVPLDGFTSGEVDGTDESVIARCDGTGLDQTVKAGNSQAQDNNEQHNPHHQFEECEAARR